MQKRSRATPSIFATLAVLATAAPGHAGLFRVESESLISARQGDDRNFELPSYEFLSANYQSLARDLELNADLAVFGDASRSRNDFKLQQLSFDYAFAPDAASFSVGRTFDVKRSIRTSLIDSAGLDFYLFEKRVRLGAFAGKEQRLERSQWTPAATLSGAYLGYTSSSLFPFSSKLKFQHRQYDRANQPSEDLAQLSMHEPFGGQLSPELLFDSEVNVDTRHLNRLDTGLDLYPSYRTALRTRLETFDLRPLDGIEQPIFSIFSQGRLYEASLQAEQQLRSDLTASLSVAYDSYVVQDPTRTDGFKVESDVFLRLRRASFHNSFYFLHSFGGQVYGGRIVLHQKLTDRFELSEAGDLAYYSKITLSRRTALNTQIEASQMLSDRLKLSIGGELNSNNNLKYDARGLLKLTYLVWTET